MEMILKSNEKKQHLCIIEQQNFFKFSIEVCRAFITATHS